MCLLGLLIWHLGTGLAKFIGDDGDSGTKVGIPYSRIARWWGVAISPDGHFLAADNTRDLIEVWDLVNMRYLRSVSVTGKVRFIPDGYFITYGNNEATKLWRLSDGSLERTLGTAGLVAISADHRLLLDRNFKVWDIKIGRMLSKLNIQDGATSAAFSPDGNTLVEGGTDTVYTLHLWRVQDGELLRTFTRPVRKERRQYSVRGVVFSPDSRTLASTDLSDPEVYLWDVSSGRLLRTLEFKLWAPNSIAFSPDGHTFAAGQGVFLRGNWKDTDSTRGSLALWDLETGNLLFRKNIASFGIVFSPDGHTLAVGVPRYEVKILDFESGKTLHTLRGESYWKMFHDNLVHYLLF